MSEKASIPKRGEAGERRDAMFTGELKRRRAVIKYRLQGLTR